MLVSEDEDIMLITDDGTIIRMPVDGISVIGRVAQGVRVMRVEDERRIVGVTATERDEDDTADDEPQQDEDSLAEAHVPQADELGEDGGEEL